MVRLMIDSEQCPIAVPCYAPLTCVPQSQTLFGEFMNKWDRWCCPSFTCQSCSEVGQSKGESAASIQLSCQLGPDRLDEGDWQLESACEVISFRGALSAAGTVDFLLEWKMSSAQCPPPPTLWRWLRRSPAATSAAKGRGRWCLKPALKAKPFPHCAPHPGVGLACPHLVWLT